MKKFFPIILFALIILTQPVFAEAQECTKFDQTVWGQFIPCNGTDECPCDFAKLMQLITNVLNFLVKISFPLATITFSWAGFTLLTSGGNSTKKDEAKKMMRSVIIGFAFILAAWLIVRTVMQVLLRDEILQGLNLL